jgi:hypothetical protein
MTQDIHDRHGSGFMRLRLLLPDVANCHPAEPKPRERRGTTGGKEQLSIFPENAINTHEQKALGKERVIGDARGKRERKGSSHDAVVDKPWMPQMLADKLNDEHNLAFYKFVVRRLPENVIRDALTRALDTPLRSIRRSRGALFASIVSPHLKNRRTGTHSSPNST